MVFHHVALGLTARRPGGRVTVARHGAGLAPSRERRTYKSGGPGDGGPWLLPAAAPIHLGPTMSAREAFAAVALNCSAHVMACTNYAGRSDDPEGVHQLRVAIRRMRSAFSVFQDAALRHHRFRIGGELHALQQTLTAAREWDVLIEDTLGRLPARLRRNRSVRNLVDLARTKGRTAHKRARTVLHGVRCRALMRRLHAWIDREFIYGPQRLQNPRWNRAALARPARVVVADILTAYHRRTCKLGRKLRELDPEGLHRLRIRIKKLRYAIEFFATLWSSRANRRYVAALKDLQKTLGRLHDSATAPELMSRLNSDATTAGLAALDRWLAKDQRQARKEAGELWRRFARREPFWQR